MSESLLQIPSEITKVVTMSHDSLRLQVDTQESLTAVAQAMVFGFKGKPGVFAFAKSEIKESDLIVPDYKPNEDELKSPSQRLRGVFYLLWQQRGKKDKFTNLCDSDTYYRQMMEEVIEFYKSKLQ
jgi:hypothetical protein